ncbi:MAG: sulfite oxidase [Saprospiraceae bacterium]|nr:sulfite oxidase [Saprospiraceae bacterium]
MQGRRRFLKNSSLSAIQLAIGAHLLNGSSSLNLNQHAQLKSLLSQIEGKHPGMRVLNDRPINAETPAHLLKDLVTPADLFFVRNNGLVPTNINADTWKLTIDGEAVSRTKTYALQELKTRFENVRYQITLECGGNGRQEFNPPAKGNQWTVGAVGCAEWTGVRLRDVLEDVGIKNNAVYIGYHGADLHLSGDPNKEVISRGVPIEKAMEPETIIAWAMNGEDLPVLNGYPLRLVIGGYPASCSGKWLTGISVRDRIHDGSKMGGQSYRVPCKPVAPGSKVADEDMCIIEQMPVKSLITYPKTGATIKLGDTLPIKGHAWAGERNVQTMALSIDFGKTWQPCNLTKAVNKFAWQHFEGKLKFPDKGYYEVWAKATDDKGESQPMLLPGWNPRGYLNNACHRIAVKVI